MPWQQIADHDLERYHFSMVRDKAELGPLESTFWPVPICVKRAEATADYVRAMLAAIISCDVDRALE